ncbi:MAG: sugar phosphate isomerase/epimerase [Negativicutes bacterium]|jgi:sugar phosphate isomerase/epimerase
MMNTLKLSISTGFCYTMKSEKLFETIAASGCKNIELLMNQVVAGMTDDEIIAVIDKYNLKVCSVHAFPQVWLPEFGDEEHAALERALQLAEHFGAQHVTSHFTPIKSNGVFVCNDDNHLKTISSFNSFCDIPVATENFPAGLPTILCNYAELLQYLEKNPLPLTFDTTHCADNGVDIFRGYEMFRPYVRNIHLSDYLSGESRKEFGRGIMHLAPGCGELPLQDFLRHIVADGYDGLLTLEMDFASPGVGNYTDGDMIAGELRKAIEYIEEIIN